MEAASRGLHHGLQPMGGEHDCRKRYCLFQWKWRINVKKRVALIRQ